MRATSTTTPNSSANSRTKQVFGASPGSRRPPGSSHSSRSFSSSATPPASTSTPLMDTGKFIRCLTHLFTTHEIDPPVFAGNPGGNALLVETQSDARPQSPSQCHQYRGKQQKAAECQ